MYQRFVSDSSFFDRLTQLDVEFSARVQRSGCPSCGGPLHRSWYPRKVRGLPRSLAQEELRRPSYCCGACRRRVTPLSLRFLGRRVYTSVVVVVLSALSGRDCSRLVLDRSADLDTLDRRTLGRWRRWWREEAPALEWFRRRRGELRGELASSDLPSSLLARFGGGAVDRLLSLLRFLTPATSRSCPLAWVS